MVPVYRHGYNKKTLLNWEAYLLVLWWFFGSPGGGGLLDVSSTLALQLRDPWPESVDQVVCRLCRVQLFNRWACPIGLYFGSCFVYTRRATAPIPFQLCFVGGMFATRTHLHTLCTVPICLLFTITTLNLITYDSYDCILLYNFLGCEN